MVRALPDDGKRYELIDGELLVTPAPRAAHQRASARLFVSLDAWLAQHPVGEVLYSPADLELEPDTIVQPDIFVVPLVEGRRRAEWSDMRSLLLAIEVLSPSTARADRQIKRRFFQRQGVAEYWIVDLDARVVERWRPGDERPEIATETLVWQPEGAATSLVIELPALFASILD